MTAVGTVTSRNRGVGPKFLRLNWAIITTLTAIAGIGVIMHFSVSNTSWAGMPLQHALRYAAILVFVLGAALIEPRRYLEIAYPLYAVALVLLIGVELFGATRLGAQRWLAIGPLSFQPSEMMKIAIVLALSRYYFEAAEAGRADRWWSLLPPIIMIGVPTALIMHQPDLGTALLVAGSGVGVMFLAGLKWRYIIPAGVLSVAAAVYAYFFLLHEYQRERVNVFLGLTNDPLGTGYNTLQAKIAIGAAGLFGHGYLQGPQSQLDFLPEKHTDFIFAMTVEEFGLIGAMVVLALYGALMWLTLMAANSARNLFSKLAAGGVAVTIAMYVFINTAMVIGLVPVVGIPLPLLSFGGTAMLTMMVGLAIVLSVHLHWDSRA